MKIQCDVCEKAPATLICIADEAALCAKCDVEIHAANRLASKHQRLLLQSCSTKLPLCDICREKTAFIFCVEDRALFCHDCDEPIHSTNTRAANHQRYLATGVRVALLSSTSENTNMAKQYPQQPPPRPPPPQPPTTNSLKSSLHQVSTTITSPSWSVDDLLHLSECENSDKKDQLEFGGLEWLTDMSLFGEQIGHEEALAAAEVPQLPVTQSSYGTSSYRTTTRYNSMPYKKARIEFPIDDDDDEYFTVPDLG